MITKISEIDNAKLIKLWNDTTKSNADICKKLDCNWSLINVKVKRVKSVADALTVERSSGKDGGVIDGAAEKSTSSKSTETAAVAAVKKTAAAKTTAAVKTVAKTSDEAKKLVADLDSNLAVYVGNEPIEWSQDINKMRDQMIAIMKRLGKTKADIIRNGERINLQDIRPGDKLVLEANIGGASV